jgi:hypothetical protein
MAPCSSAGPSRPLPQTCTWACDRGAARGAACSVAATTGSTSASMTAKSRPVTSRTMRAGTASPPGSRTVSAPKTAMCFAVSTSTVEAATPTIVPAPIPLLRGPLASTTTAPSWLRLKSSASAWAGATEAATRVPARARVEAAAPKVMSGGVRSKGNGRRGYRPFHAFGPLGAIHKRFRKHVNRRTAGAWKPAETTSAASLD